MSDYKKLTQEKTGTGASDPILFKNVRNPDFAMLLCAYVTGTVTYDIEYTIDDIENDNWITLGTLDRAASSDDSFYFPVVGVRVNIKTGTGTVKLITQFRN